MAEATRGRDRRARSAATPRTASSRGARAGRGAPRLGVVAATNGLLGLSSTRRAAVLAAVVCVLALTVAVPLRNYVVQRQELSAAIEQRQELVAEVAELTAERERLKDPGVVEAEARARLGYVMPGEIPYVVQLPEPARAGRAAYASDTDPWYQRLWSEITTPVAGP